MLVLGERDGIAAVVRRRGLAARPSNSRRIGGATAGKHELHRILGQRILERRLLADERTIGLVEEAVPAVVPVDGLEHDLAFPRPIEDERRAGAMLGRAAPAPRAPPRAAAAGA